MHCWGRNDVYIYKVSGTRILWYSITVFYVMMKKKNKKQEEFCAVIDCFCRKERAESCLFDYCCLSQIPQISMLPVVSLNCERSVLQQCAFSREPIQDLSRLPISFLLLHLSLACSIPNIFLDLLVCSFLPQTAEKT